jgi:hypothetical protein
MGKAAAKPILYIPISEAARRVLKTYPARIARRAMRRGLAGGRIRCDYQEVIDDRDGDPLPNDPKFWRPDPRGDRTDFTRFPWPGNAVRRLVYLRGHRGPISDITAIGVVVAWEDVVAELPAIVDEARKTQRKGGRKPSLTDEEIKQGREVYGHLLTEHPNWGKNLHADAAALIDRLKLNVSTSTVIRHVIAPYEKQKAK